MTVECRNKAAAKMLKFVQGCRRHIEVWTRMRYWKQKKIETLKAKVDYRLFEKERWF